MAILSVGGDVAFTGVVAGGVAIFTGLLTARTTNARQERQLAYERLEADRAELRNALDGAGAAAIAVFHRLVGAAEALRPGNYDLSSEAVFERQLAKGRADVRDAFAAHGELTPHTARLQLRLGASHETVRKIVELTGLVNEAAEVIPASLPGTDQEADQYLARTEAYMRGMEDFLESGHDLIGTSEPALRSPSGEAEPD